MGLYKRSISYAKPYKKYLFIGIFFNIFYAIFNVLALLFMMPILKILFDQKEKRITSEPIYSGKLTEIGTYLDNSFKYFMQNIADERGGAYVLLVSCVLFICMFFLRNVFSYFSEYFLVYLRSGVAKDFRVMLHDKILELPVAYFTDKRKGDMITRIASDVGEVENNILNGLVDIIRSPITIIITMTTLFYLSYQLTLFTLIVFPVMGTIISLIGKSLKRDTGKAQQELGLIFSYVDETLNALKIIKIFNASAQIKKRFDASIEKFRNISIKLFKKKALSSPISEFLGAITIAMIVYFGGRLSLEGKGLKGDEFIVYIGMFYTILDPIKRFSRSLSDIQKGQVSAQRIFEVLDTHLSIQDKPNAIPIQQFNQKIEFKNISFSYENHLVLQDFSLTIEKGQTVALVGQSGSGKSTLANLITRFYDVNQGEILLDGKNIKDIKLKDYRALFGLVTQDSILFNDTIFKNIALGNENATLEQVQQAAEIANAHEFIKNLPEKYQTNIGESGGKLSGGQKQRISIARAVMKNPPIMILDEATSALDTESEKLVQVALEQMLENRTSLVIAHRLSTIQKADLIVVMEQGKIIEQGSHNDLMQHEGKYAQLVKLQGF